MYPAGGRKVFILGRSTIIMNIMESIFEMIGNILEGSGASEASKAVIAALKEFFGKFS